MSNQDDKFDMLRQTSTPAPSEAARRRALDAALLAFDAEQEDAAKAAKGNPTISRLRSIFLDWKGKWTMDTRLTYGLGTAAIALLLLPLGYQLYSSTAITPLELPKVMVRQAEVPEMGSGATIATRTSAERDEAADATAPIAGGDMQAAAPAMEAEMPVAEAVPAPKQQMFTEERARPSGPATQQSPMRNFSAAMPSAAAPALTRESVYAPRAEPRGDQFTTFSESPVKIAATEPVSTFSIDVDTASYAYVRRMLNAGRLPSPDAVRVEEMINYFDYGYPSPTDASTPFTPTVQVYPTPWNAKTQIVQIGIKGYLPPEGAEGFEKRANLVLLIDTSGSMDEPDKLPLLKRAFGLLVDQLGENDTISIVTYAGSAGVVLEPTKGSDKARILSALDNLSAGGSTAGAQGIELAYQLAADSKVEGGVNRVILATDGDFNVGISDPEQLKSFIRDKRDNGVFLSVLGFGQGNLGDDTMQALAQNGNGNASYIDSFREAQKVLVHEAGSTLLTIAKDVKIQVEFNPAVVSEYRLIGYETRALNREDFNNDRVDAGEIGAGTTVTALYEITPVGSGAALNDPLRYGERQTAPEATGDTEIGYLKLRYKLPEGDASILVEQPIGPDAMVDDLQNASDDARFAASVAAFGQKLKGSSFAEMRWDEIRQLATGARGTDEYGYRAEFVQLLDLAAALDPEPFCTAPDGNRNCR
jgi:Ca-activated chloride channel family protein